MGLIKIKLRIIFLTLAKPSNDASNKPPATKAFFLLLLCAMNSISFCIHNGAAYHFALYLLIQIYRYIANNIDYNLLIFD